MPNEPQMHPHTLAKHKILNYYLSAWFPILGRKYKQITYIDGFAGPGRYSTGEYGSPIIAIDVAKNHLARGTLDPSVIINFIFVESNSESCTKLKQNLDSITIPSNFYVNIIGGEFESEIEKKLNELESEKRSLAPTFAFVDPFGFKGIPFELLKRILSFKSCEVFINIMVEFINRFLEHPNDSIVAHFPRTFGTNKVLEIPQLTEDRTLALLSLYERQLKQAAGVRFVNRFDMLGRNDQRTYSLFFASNSAKGFIKMKEAMWSVDKGEGESFSDFEPNQASQLRLFTLSQLWELVIERFRGNQVIVGSVTSFVETETVFLRKHLLQVLKNHEINSSISVFATRGYNRPPLTYKDDKVYIRFPS